MIMLIYYNTRQPCITIFTVILLYFCY